MGIGNGRKTDGFNQNIEIFSKTDPDSSCLSIKIADSAFNCTLFYKRDKKSGKCLTDFALKFIYAQIWKYKILAYKFSKGKKWNSKNTPCNNTVKRHLYMNLIERSRKKIFACLHKNNTVMPYNIIQKFANSRDTNY